MQQRKGIRHIQGSSLRFSVYFSAETLQARKSWDDTCKEVKKKKKAKPCQLKILVLEKLSFKMRENV